MDKYRILMILNIPFVFFGIFKAAMLWRTKVIGSVSFVVRMAFWLVVLIGLLFAKEVYQYLIDQGLTDSTPLSLADVVLTTGVLSAIFMCFRLYTRIDALEHRLSDMNEKISIKFSDKA